MEIQAGRVVTCNLADAPFLFPMSDSLTTAPESARPASRGRGKKRSRRNKPNWGMRGLVALGGLLVLAFLAYFCFGLWLKSYLRSAGFQTLLSEQLASKIKAQSEFDGMALHGNQAQMQKMTAVGYSDASFSKLIVDDVRADVKLDLWDRRVEVPSVKVSRVQLVVSEDGRLPRPFAEAVFDGPTAPASSSWLDSFKPNEITLGEIKIDETSLLVKSAQGELRMNGLPLTIKGSGDLQSWSLSSHPQGDRAQLITNVGPGMRLQIIDLDARLRPDQFDLLAFEGDLTPLSKPGGKKSSEFSKARVAIVGSQHYEGQVAAMDFHLTASDLDIHDWVEETWVKRLSGKADLKAHLQGSPSDAASMIINGSFSMKKAVLTSLPFLENLAERTKTAEFTRLELNTSRCDFTQQGDTWHLTNVEVEARGLLSLEGSLMIRGNEIAGVFEVGVTPGRLKAIDGAEQRVFVRDARGYKWAVPAMRITGTLDNIQEDLASRIKDAWFDQQIENVTNLATKSPEEMLKGGTEVLKEGVKAVPDVINQGLNIFNSFLPKGK